MTAKTFHILGMAKSPLTMKGSQPRSLELDFFKLAFAVARLRSSGHRASGYLQVLGIAAKKRAEGWIDKYGIEDEIQILYYAPTAAEQRRLEQEKLANKEGLAGKAIALKSGRKSSDASYGRELCERVLRVKLKEIYPGVTELKGHPKNELPASTVWDYYGIIRSES